MGNSISAVALIVGVVMFSNSGLATALSDSVDPAGPPPSTEALIESYRSQHRGGNGNQRAMQHQPQKKKSRHPMPGKVTSSGERLRTTLPAGNKK